jgi:hypothetical protein
VPITVAAGAAAVVGIAVGLDRRALGQNAEQARTSSSASCCCSESACSCSRCGGIRRTARGHPPLRRRLLAAPAGGADDRPPGLHLLGLNDGNATIGEGLVVILLYVALG